MAVNWLGQVVGEACVEVFLACAGNGVGGQCDDGLPFAEMVHLSHMLEGLDAVHLGHAVVEENHVVGLFLDHLEADGTGEGGVDLNLRAF